MIKALKVLAPAAALAVGLAITGAEAAPAASGLTPLKTLPAAASAVEKTHWVRRCHWRHGHRHCYNVWYGPRRHWRH